MRQAWPKPTRRPRKTQSTGRRALRGNVDAETRFEKAVRWGEPSDFAPHLGPCLMYIGADNGNGYGQFTYNRKNGYAHRYAWERKRGPIPNGMTVDHLCRVRKCVNIGHLELVDGPTNTRRAAALRTRCKNGHEFTPDNTRVRRGHRECLACDEVYRQRSEFKRTLAYLGRPSRSVKYDQAVVREVISTIRRAETTIAQGAREIGCNPNYLGRRVWQETKKDVFARDGGCLFCGSIEQMDAHHRRARGAGGSASPATSFAMANLVTLCRAHHQQVEQNPDWARSRGLRLDPGRIFSESPVLYRGRWVLLGDDGSVVPAGGES